MKILSLTYGGDIFVINQIFQNRNLLYPLDLANDEVNSYEPLWHIKNPVSLITTPIAHFNNFLLGQRVTIGGEDDSSN